MGKIAKNYYDELIDPVADRNSNRVRVYRAPNNEITIHFRNLKIVLHTEEEIRVAMSDSNTDWLAADRLMDTLNQKE